MPLAGATPWQVALKGVCIYLLSATSCVVISFLRRTVCAIKSLWTRFVVLSFLVCFLTWVKYRLNRRLGLLYAYWANQVLW